jgi:hypothetical protein
LLELFLNYNRTGCPRNCADGSGRGLLRLLIAISARRGSDCLEFQWVFASLQGELFLIMALRMSRSFLMQAVMITLKGLPAAANRRLTARTM